jgi:DNA-binding transcriptional LysR family regulator
MFKKASDSTVSWDCLRYFLEVSRAGSMNSAARSLGVEHTTVSRRMKALETRLGARLFERSGQRLKLTADGEHAFMEAERMETSALSLVRSLKGGIANLKGEVRINVSEGLATYWLMPRMAEFQRSRPGLQLNWIVTTNSVHDFGSMVDLAVGWHEPDQPSVVRQRLGHVGYSLYAFPAYCERYGTPSSWEDLRGHRFIHYNAYDNHPAFVRWCKLMRETPPVMLLENVGATHAAIGTGDAMALLPDYATQVAPDLVRMPMDTGIVLELSLCYHENSRKVARVRAVVEEVQRLALQDRNTWFTR